MFLITLPSHMSVEKLRISIKKSHDSGCFGHRMEPRLAKHTAKVLPMYHDVPKSTYTQKIKCVT